MLDNNFTPSIPFPARRFDIQVPLRYRAIGETEWHEGRTQNISHTGVRFWADQLMEVHTPVELSFEMPAEIAGERGAEVVCKGEIVSTVAPSSPEGQPALVAGISEYHFVRGKDRFAT